MRENISKVPQKSKTWEGFSYSINQEKYLKVFLDDGEVPMDNNAAEQSIRGFCIGKKNWVMIDTVADAKSSAIIYSIAETAKANNLKPYDYFEYLLTEIPKHLDDTGRNFLDDMLPWSPNLPANNTFTALHEMGSPENSGLFMPYLSAQSDIWAKEKVLERTTIWGTFQC